MLTSDQIAHWNAFGFLVLPKLFNQNEVTKLRDAAIEVIKQNDGEKAITDSEKFGIGAFCEQHPVLRDWLVDDRIYGIPESLLGSDFILDLNSGYIFTGDTLWHGGFAPDETEESFNTVCKVVMYFDSLTKENGALRVVPGTHRRPFGANIWPQQAGSNPGERERQPFGVPQEDVPCVDLQSDPGDIIVFTERVFHSSFGSKKGRLQISAEYSANPTTEAQIDRMRADHDRFAYSHHPSKSFINSENPKLRRMVSRMVELGFTPREE